MLIMKEMKMTSEISPRDDSGEPCAKCGYEEWKHPVGFVSMGKFRWVCKKFKPSLGCGKRFEKKIKGLHINVECGDKVANEVQLCPECEPQNNSLNKLSNLKDKEPEVPCGLKKLHSSGSDNQNNSPETLHNARGNSKGESDSGEHSQSTQNENKVHRDKEPEGEDIPSGSDNQPPKTLKGQAKQDIPLENNRPDDNLSSKIGSRGHPYSTFINTKDVKEAVQKLKENNEGYKVVSFDKINKIFGDELTSQGMTQEVPK